MNDIHVILPTRGRLGRLKEAVRSFKDTRRGSARLWVVPHWDDRPTDWPYWISDHVMCLPDEDLSMAEAFDFFARDLSRLNNLIGLGANDLIWRTEGWDLKFIEAWRKNGPGVYYARDCVREDDLCTHPYISSDLIRTLGYGAIPGTKHLFLDNTWYEIGKGLGRLFYLPDVVIEHMHMVKHPELDDDHYRRVNSAEMYAADGALFEKWKKERLPAELEKIRAELKL